MNYIEVAMEITPYTEENAEIVMAMLDDIPFESFSTEEPLLKGYIGQDNFNQQNLKTVLSYFNGGASGFEVSYTTSFIQEENWNQTWESDFEPIFIDGLVTVKAPFHKNLPLTKYNIRIEPKMAFGTGHHQTTTMMVKALLDLNGEGEKSAELCGADGLLGGWRSVRGKQVLDMGTGTGVLAILAAKMRAKRAVHAIDVDIVAVNSAKENAWKNRLAEAVHTLYGDGSLIQANKYDLILANINRNILMQDMDTYYRGMRKGGVLVLSGFYTEDIPVLENCAVEKGFKMVATRDIDNWASIILYKE
ncbi:MAG: 50S ribosomal protein L11 methyltransferase [Bacteroidales bacterium]|jgi:ribosomal protein L11 methyltransferase|nr:50S ribosomal protein L11 methyltransferase [Bacteroidales bacterium]MBQ5827372.1 50S ribosomal protein L11 methyltransferase [Bacteroidales bacterium]